MEETQRRPPSCHVSRQVGYYVTQELSASLKIQHKDKGLRNQFVNLEISFWIDPPDYETWSPW